MSKSSNKRSKSAALRAAMMAAVTPRDIYDIVKLQVFLARKGDIFAVREVLDRVVGKPVSVAEMEQGSAGDGLEFASVTMEQLNVEIRAMHATIPAPPPKSLPAPAKPVVA